MSLYIVILFVHIVSAFVIFAGTVLEWIGLAHLRKATRNENVHVALRLFAPLGAMMPISGAAVMLSGLYMSFAHWGFEAWIVASLLIVLAMSATGRNITGRRLARIAQSTPREPGELPEDLRALNHDRVLYVAHDVRIGLLLAVVALMVFKPGPLGVAVWVVVAPLASLVLRPTHR